MRTFILALIVLALSSHAALASELYSLDSSGIGGTLYTLNQSTAAETLVGPVSPAGFPGDLTSDTRLASFGIWAPDITTNSLIKIDPNTGLGTPVGVFTTQGHAITSLAFDITTGRMYGTTSSAYSGEPDRLYAIDHNTAVANPIGAGIGFGNVWALAFNNLGKLYGVANDTHQLILIDTATGAGGLVAPVGPLSIFDIATRPEDNVTFAANAFSNELYTLDLNTGATTLVGTHTLPTHNMVGLAFGPVPEPTTLTLLTAATLVTLRRKRR
jgi:hypothetical protein